ncbi:MAG: D-glucuronyl C5-epimerase family protein [Candidatus Thorarchaeota archaeon]
MLFPVVFLNRTQIYSTFIKRYDRWTYSLTEDGLPITDYGYQASVYIGPQITPRMVANAAFGYYNQMEEGNTSAGMYFNNTVDWLIENRETRDVLTENGTVRISHWPYDFAIWDLPEGWYSAMVDAKALYALALAFILYGDSSLQDICEETTSSFEIPIAQGGNVLFLEDGTSWYPEYIVNPELDSSYESPLVLNGFLIALNNLYWANEIFNCSRLDVAFEKGAESAAANLHLYDLPYNWTLYHIAYPQKLASRSYHNIHIEQTEYLYQHTNNSIFDFYSSRWAEYEGPPLFTWEEIFSFEFIGNGLIMAGIIFVPLLAIDICQTIIRRYLSSRRTQPK